LGVHRLAQLCLDRIEPLDPVEDLLIELGQLGGALVDDGAQRRQRHADSQARDADDGEVGVQEHLQLAADHWISWLRSAGIPESVAWSAYTVSDPSSRYRLMATAACTASARSGTSLGRGMCRYAMRPSGSPTAAAWSSVGWRSRFRPRVRHRTTVDPATARATSTAATSCPISFAVAAGLSVRDAEVPVRPLRSGSGPYGSVSIPGLASRLGSGLRSSPYRSRSAVPVIVPRLPIAGWLTHGIRAFRSPSTRSSVIATHPHYAARLRPFRLSISRIRPRGRSRLRG